MIKKINWQILFVNVAVALNSACSSNVSNEKTERPNIVFIMVDDLGWSDLSYNGSKVYDSPNVDRLSQQGMTFSNFYSAGPVCSPTRVSILSGKYPVRTGITTYLLAPELDPKHIASHFPLEEITFAEALKEYNYKTGYFGKWHLGYAKEHWAANQGFDVAIGGMDLDWAWKIAHPEVEAPDVDRGRGHKRFFSPHHLTFMEDGSEGEYLTERLTNETIKFITENKDEPFFAYLSFHTVHTPLQAKEEVVERYTNKIHEMGLDTMIETNTEEKTHQNNPNYAAMVYHMDENVGRVMDCLKELNLEENTILIFTSDNGGKGSVTSNLPLKGMKHNLDEGGIRVPTIVQWKGKIESGSVCNETLISNDFYPTFLDLANAPLRPEQHLDGISFKDILLGTKTKTDRDAIYFHYPHSRMEGAVIMGDYKLLYYYKTGETKLYNLKDDIGELNDLSQIEKEKAAEMLQMLKAWLKEVNANFPEGFIDSRNGFNFISGRLACTGPAKYTTGKNIKDCGESSNHR
ncbi:MAG: sulfatase [Prolixibacteraceae bacterium]|jgi:arylsulfatase A-like enzyme|nr:sulfatase [Prolixibacteraceae bacterium]MBT6006672.1 sulfatase [Prolixibacteraceae bacterium]MBT6763971.1 sulfatase [Prolixibacteraceae bacterium]MBT6998224.1 sulfatase [Prolixibacteraceae bacterium]MBT7394160.1 sulfatase [Prolixibacteraceae bacterium]